MAIPIAQQALTLPGKVMGGLEERDRKAVSRNWEAKTVSQLGVISFGFG